ncbi:hypothetical protein JCM8547_001609 [Rhodosporidiobolus lusitaniae]
MGGLGLIDPEEIDKANSLRFLSSLFSQAELPWIDIAFSSLARASHPQLSIPALYPSCPTPSSFRTAWSALRPSAQLPKDPFWRIVLSAGRSHPPALVLPSWKTADLLSIPPSLLSAASALSSLDSLAPLYHHGKLLLGVGPGYGAFRLNDRDTTAGIGRARKDWQEEVNARPELRTARRSLSALSALCDVSPLSPAFSSISPTHLDEIELNKLWSWVQRRPATAREADTDWRLLHGALATRGRLYCLGHTEGKVIPPWPSTLTTGTEKEHHPTLRAVVAVALHLRHDTRLSHIRSSSPSSTSPSPPDLALRAVGVLSARLG